MPQFGLCFLAIRVEGLDFPVYLGSNGTQLTQVLLGKHTFVDYLIKSGEHEPRQGNYLSLVIVQNALALLGSGRRSSLEIVIVNLLIGFPEISESRGNLHAVFPLGACFVTILGAGSEMIVTDERDSQVEAKGMDVRDVEAGHHGVEDDSGVLNGVLVDVVADTGLHCDAVRLWVDEFFGEDFEDGCRVGTGLGYLEHAKHAEPVVVVRDDAVVTDHEVPVFDAHCCEL